MSAADELTMGTSLVSVNTFGFLAARRFNQVSREDSVPGRCSSMRPSAIT